jgi:hypothetical protein
METIEEGCRCLWMKLWQGISDDGMMISLPEVVQVEASSHGLLDRLLILLHRGMYASKALYQTDIDGDSRNIRALLIPSKAIHVLICAQCAIVVF